METISIKRGDALILIDIQNDFLPGGHLAVAQGNEIIPILNRYIELFHRQQYPIFITRDWHPINHCSFISQGGIWPEHCIQNTPGAEFPSDLVLPKTAYVINKAQHSDQDAYSAFDSTSLHIQLKTLNIIRLFIGGLATDYCVLKTVLDAIKLCYKVIVLEDAIRAVRVKPEDENNAKLEMQQAGAVLTTITHTKIQIA